MDATGTAVSDSWEGPSGHTSGASSPLITISFFDTETRLSRVRHWYSVPRKGDWISISELERPKVVTQVIWLDRYVEVNLG